jgi:hypothetical protein
MKKSVFNLRRSILLAVAIGLLVPAIAINGYSWLNIYEAEVKKTQSNSQKKTPSPWPTP